MVKARIFTHEVDNALSHDDPSQLEVDLTDGDGESEDASYFTTNEGREWAELHEHHEDRKEQECPIEAEF